MHFATGMKAGTSSNSNQLLSVPPQKTASQREAEQVRKQEAAATHRAARSPSLPGVVNEDEDHKVEEKVKTKRKSLIQKPVEQVKPQL